MLVPDPALAAREIRRVLRPGGRVSVAVWGPRERNPWLGVVFAAVADALGEPVPPPGLPHPFSLGDPDRLAARCSRRAGLEDVRSRRSRWHLTVRCRSTSGGSGRPRWPARWRDGSRRFDPMLVPFGPGGATRSAATRRRRGSRSPASRWSRARVGARRRLRPRRWAGRRRALPGAPARGPGSRRREARPGRRAPSRRSIALPQRARRP